MRRTILIPAAIAAFALSACGSDSGSSSAESEIKKLMAAELEELTEAQAGSMPKEVRAQFDELMDEQIDCFASAMTESGVTVEQFKKIIKETGLDDDDDDAIREIVGDKVFEKAEAKTTACETKLAPKFEELYSSSLGE